MMLHALIGRPKPTFKKLTFSTSSFSYKITLLRTVIVMVGQSNNAANQNIDPRNCPIRLTDNRSQPSAKLR